jgi:hypothetical protein
LIVLNLFCVNPIVEIHKMEERRNSFFIGNLF